MQWASGQYRDGPLVAADGARALVVGCGLGEDAEYIARLGFATIAFDIAPTAIAAAGSRFPGSPVDYQVADLLTPPNRWSLAFDLVVESITVQALPDPPRAAALARLGEFVAPGGTLIVIARRREPGAADSGPPWSLTRRNRLDRDRRIAAAVRRPSNLGRCPHAAGSPSSAGPAAGSRASSRECRKNTAMLGTRLGSA